MSSAVKAPSMLAKPKTVMYIMQPGQLNKIIIL